MYFSDFDFTKSSNQNYFFDSYENQICDDLDKKSNNNFGNLIDQSKSSLTFNSSIEENYLSDSTHLSEKNLNKIDKKEIVQNYGFKDSDEYRDKRNRNNEAVRKARKKFQAKQLEVSKRVEKLRLENEELSHRKDNVLSAYKHIKDLHDKIFQI